MIGCGVFGKLPAHGDFVAVGASSPTGRSFDAWLRMANDQVAQARRKLPSGPIGFCYRDAAGASWLVGVIVASVDRVGRTFPLALFCELELTPETVGAGIPAVFHQCLAELSQVALRASDATATDLQQALSGLPLPNESSLPALVDAELERLKSVELSVLANHMVGQYDADSVHTVGASALAFATDVLLRACDNARIDGPQRAMCIDFTVSSDLELMFWLLAAESRTQRKTGLVSVFWDVAQARTLVALGVPDTNMLNFLCSQTIQHAKLWSAKAPSPTARAAAISRLAPSIASFFNDPSQHSAWEFIQSLSPATNDIGKD